MTRNELSNGLIILTPQNGWTRNLVAIQMQNGQNNPITDGVQKMDAFPGTLKWGSFCFTIPDDGYNDQIRIVKGCTEGMGEDVPQLASFVNGAWSGNTHMAGYTSRGRELAKQATHPLTVLRDLWIDLRV